MIIFCGSGGYLGDFFVFLFSQKDINIIQTFYYTDDDRAHGEK